MNWTSRMRTHGRRYIVDARAGLVGAFVVALVAVVLQIAAALPSWLLVAGVLLIPLVLAVTSRRQRRRQNRLADVLQDPSSSSSAFKLVRFIRDAMRAGWKPDGLTGDINTAVTFRRYPHSILAEPFLNALMAGVSPRQRESLERLAGAMLRERDAVRELAIRQIRAFLDQSLSEHEIIVLYGYSSTVCDGLIRRDDRATVTFVIEDLQYGANSVREHEIVKDRLTRAGLPCHVIPFSECDRLLDARSGSVTTLDGGRLSLSPQRKLLALLGCDALDLEGRALIPSVIAGTPSDSACLAEAFLLDQPDGMRVPRNLVIVGESYKIAGVGMLTETRTSAPLRTPRWVRGLHFFGLAVPFRSTPVNLYRIESGLAAIVTDAGVFMAAGRRVGLSEAYDAWNNRIDSGEWVSRPGSPTPDHHPALPADPSHRAIAGVILDWNGVLAYDEPIHFSAFARLCRETTGRSLNLAEYDRLCSGITDEEGVQNLVRAGVLAGNPADLVGEKQKHYRDLLRGEGDILSPATKSFVAVLREREIAYRVVTASPRDEVAGARAAAGVDKLFPDDMIEAGVRSSDRFLALRRAARIMDRQPGSILLVDDNENNIAMGRRLGMITARVDSRPTDCDTQADYCVADIGDLVPVVSTATAEPGGYQHHFGDSAGSRG